MEARDQEAGIRTVTTCHKDGYTQYGLKFVEGWKHWPEEAELWWYTEEFTPPALPRTTFIDNTNVQDLQNFKQKYINYEPVSWQWDVVKFSNKVYAAYDALFDYKGIGVWLDADCVTYKPISAEYLRSLLPDDCYLALFKRIGMHSETGFWIMNCAHEQHQAFLQDWVGWYETGNFRKLASWHDCTMLDATIRRFEKNGLIKTHSLSGEHEKDMHPMAKSDISKYLDHCKGRRKVHGFSPENEHYVEYLKSFNEPLYMFNDTK